MKRTAFLVLALAASFASLSGQTYQMFSEEMNQIREKAPFSFGPLRLFPSLALRNVGYDSNVFFDARPKADYTGTFSPEVRAYLPLGGTILFTARENPEYSFYLNEKNRREFSNSFGFGLRALVLGRFVLDGSAHYDKHRRPQSSELGALVTDTSKGYEAGLTFETPRRTSLGIKAVFNDVSLEDYAPAETGVPLSGILNRIERGLQAEFNYEISPGGYFFLSGMVTEFAFASAVSNWKDSTAMEGFAGVRFPIGGKIRGTLALGFKKFAPKEAGPAEFSGLVGKTELEGRFGPLGLRASYSRDSVFSVWTDVLFFIDSRYGAGASFYLTPFLRLDYNYDLGNADYPDFPGAGPAPGEGSSGRRRDNHATHSAGIVVRLFGNTGLGLTWNSARWTSTMAGWDRRREFIGVFLTYEF